jgi:AcrR family transcriptional regulator
MAKSTTALKRTRHSRLSTELRQETVLEEATRIIAERGYKDISIQEVADRCRISKTLLLYYFGSKDGLLVALLQFRVSRDTAALSWLRSEVNTRGEVTLKSVHKMLHAIVERNVSQPGILRFYCVLRAEALDRDHPAYAFFLERQKSTLRHYEQALAPNDPQPEFTARQLMALMIGLEEQWLREEEKFDLLKHWDHAVARLLPLKEL